MTKQKLAALDIGNVCISIHLGNLFNLKMYTGASMSYVTYGQNVPDDIMPFNPQSTVKQLLSTNEQE